MTKPLAVAYDDKLLLWKGSAASPVRAKLCVEALAKLGLELDVQRIEYHHGDIISKLKTVHDADYVTRVVRDGEADEWMGRDVEQGAVAMHMFAGTVQLVRQILDGDADVAFSPQGAKHHAMYAQSSGFCVFNDMAWAAAEFTRRGKRVLYIDFDAHHGDGVEALTRDNSMVQTHSIHEWGIFPGTGRESEARKGVYNYPLGRGAGGTDMLWQLEKIMNRAEQWKPDVVLIAVGADGHMTDPLSSLQYDYPHYAQAGSTVGEFAARAGVPLLMGGAGGYQAETHTPLIWATFVAAAYGTYNEAAGQAAERAVV